MSNIVSIEDALIRKAAFEHMQLLSDRFDGRLPIAEIRKGFVFRNDVVHLVSGRGIHKPRQMDLPLTITTTHNSPYDDSFSADNFVSYRYQGTDSYSRDNVLLRTVYQKKLPLIYFHGLEVGVYMAMWPGFVVADSPDSLTFTIACDDARVIAEPNYDSVGDEDAVVRRRYVTSVSKVRLHQGIFRERVLKAYRHQCTLCRLQHVSLLDAAHIIPDSDVRGEPVVSNGLSLCKIHHAAYDKHIIGISTDYKTVVREDILHEIDGPMLKHGIQEMDGQKLQLPRSDDLKPNREFLAERYSQFLKA